MENDNRKSRILFVDDDEINVILFKRQFEKHFDILGFTYPEEALEAIKTENIDMILSDERMPIMSGIELLTRAAALKPDAKRILLTAFPDAKAIEKAINQASIWKHITKPWSKDALLDMLRNGLEISRLQKEKRYVEDSVILKEERLSAVFNSVHEGLLVLDEDYKILQVNPMLCSMFEEESFELEGRELQSLFPIEEQSVDTPINELLVEMLTDDNTDDALLYGRTASGSLLPLELSLSQYENQTGKYMIAVVRDISEKLIAYKALIGSEKKFRGIFESMVDIYFRADEVGDIVLVSPSVESILGYTAEECYQMPLSELLGSDFDVKEFYEKFAKSGKPVEMETSSFTKDNERKILSVKIKVTRDQQSAVIGIEGLARDITERRQLEKKILSSILEAEDMERSRLAKELHDGVGQYLSASLLYLDNTINTIKKDTELKSNLVKTREFLRTAIKETRNVAHNFTPTATSELGLSSSIQSMLNDLEKVSGINFTCFSNLEETLPIEMENMIFRVFQESMNNVLKHSDASEVNVQLVKSDLSVLFTVADDGIGFQESEIGESDRFGLDSMKTRATLMGGSFHVDSRRGKGTVITLDIPLTIN